jgi:hypothetical protein
MGMGPLLLKFASIYRRGSARWTRLLSARGPELARKAVSSATITFDFTAAQGGAMGEGSVGNTRTFTSGGVGFGGVQNDSALATSLFRDVSINGGFANALLFGGFLGGDDEDDRFKITSLSATTAVPEPATMLLLVAGSGVLHRLRRRATQKQDRV